MLILSLLSPLLIWSKVHAAIPALDPAFDLSAAYQSAKITDDQSSRGQNLIHELSHYQVLLVPGFHYEKIPDIFAPEIAWLTENKIDHKMLETHPAGSVVENAKMIADYIQSSSKELLILASSKGNLDTLEALLKLKNDQSLKKVKAFVSFQAPYYGTPLADEVQQSNNPVILFFVRVFLGGDTQSLKNLTMRMRDEYMKRRNEEILSLIQRIRILNLTTWRPLYRKDSDGNQAKLESKLWQVNKLMTERGYKNDGMVPVYSGCLPKSGCVVIGDLDHISTVSRKWAHEYDATTLIRSMLALTLGI